MVERERIMPNTNNIDYIDSTDYKKLETKIRDLVTRMDEAAVDNQVSRNLRYVEIDIEGERARGKLQPDELVIPLHIIDSNVRREQPSYVQYITQSLRSNVLKDTETPSNDTVILETDVTIRFRYPGWQIPMFANIDGFQQNGYGVMELVMDKETPDTLKHEFVAFGDFGITMDTKDLQECEIVARNYYFTKTALLKRASHPDPDQRFTKEQVDIIVDQQPDSNSNHNAAISLKDESLYKIQKVMFRVNGIVHVAWTKYKVCTDWLRVPRPLYIGRRAPKVQLTPQDLLIQQTSGVPMTDPVYETNYPYFVFPYLISENSTISQLKGRAFLDQDTQQATSSLLSSFVTAHRRAAGLYFSKDTEDPNDDVGLQKNVFFKQGCLINAKIKQFQLVAPGSDLISGINLLVSSNQQETSQVNFAASNRKDSRKTAKEIGAAESKEVQLTTTQVVLFSTALTSMDTVRFEVLQSRVMAGLIKVNPTLQQMYARRYSVRPAGDTDVIERQQLLSAMTQAWPVLSQTAAAVPFLCDMLMLAFPTYAPKYTQILMQAQQAQQSQQAQQQAQMMGQAKQIGAGLVQLSKKPEMFSDTGKIHALPALEQAASMIETMTGTQQ